MIVGGGIAGLSAAWWLQREGYTNFTLLELEDQVGGNARSGKNTVSAYPWGAHYIPLPGAEAVYVRQLFEDLGVITGTDAQQRPIYNPLYLCHDPEERLLKDGVWQEGLVPHRGVPDAERKEIQRFLAHMGKLTHQLGRDGRLAFTTPIAHSSSDPQFTQWDRLTMADWLRQQGYTATALLWYVNYCCRDDYGATIDTVSAWAGLHYFCGRRGIAANAEPNTVVTWPEGNGWIVSRLRERLTNHLQTGALVQHITPNGSGTESAYRVTYQPAPGQASHAIDARQVILAVPRFIAGHLLPPSLLQTLPKLSKEALQYAPWLVANITLANTPGGRGCALAWDNVSMDSPALGYVVATHQAITTQPGKTVITYYHPLTHLPPAQARQWGATRTHADWCRDILTDLNRMHPGITASVEYMVPWVWGHGMIQPTPGFIWGGTRDKLAAALPGLHFAHSDMSGLSLFEEAQYHGVQAAKAVLQKTTARG